MQETRHRYPTVRRTAIAMGAATVALSALTGCHIDMWIQPKLKPGQESTFFVDGQGSRSLEPHTVMATEARSADPFYNKQRTDNPFYTGYVGDTHPSMVNGKNQGGTLVDMFPFKVTHEVLERGQDRFNIYCSPCHGRVGDGMGMIAMRGFSQRRPPASYHTDRLRKMPIGHFFDVITNGYGAMYSYAARIEPRDRWAVAAYIRVLQESQHASATDLSADEVKALNSPTPGPVEGGAELK